MTEPVAEDRWVFALYVTGTSASSLRAIHNLRRLCEEHLAGRHAIEIVDLYRQPARAAEADLLCAPTLVRRLPLPLRKMIGDLSNERRVLAVLQVLPS